MHFTVGIIIPPDLPTDNIGSYIEAAMAPYDEARTVEPYVCYSPAQAQAELTREVRRFERILGRQEEGYQQQRCREILAELRATTPQQRYRAFVRNHDRVNGFGQPISTANPQAKWAGYAVGGRWDGWIQGRRTSAGRIADNLATTEETLFSGRIPHALITIDGKWLEHGQLGWWEVLLTEEETEPDQVRDLLARHPLACHPGHHLVIVDAHI